MKKNKRSKEDIIFISVMATMICTVALIIGAYFGHLKDLLLVEIGAAAILFLILWLRSRAKNEKKSEEITNLQEQSEGLDRRINSRNQTIEKLESQNKDLPRITAERNQLARQNLEMKYKLDHFRDTLWHIYTASTQIPLTRAFAEQCFIHWHPSALELYDPLRYQTDDNYQLVIDENAEKYMSILQQEHPEKMDSVLGLMPSSTAVDTIKQQINAALHKPAGVGGGGGRNLIRARKQPILDDRNR